jgi:NADH:ubiquinone oxidoreductase subunit F (NADH-binding)/NADH:ubiquinone oxidoreductase subunit E
VNLIDELNTLQTTRGYLRQRDLRELAQRLRIPQSQVETVSSFYPHFRRTPPSDTRVTVCRDLSCKLRAGEEKAAHLEALCDSRSNVSFERVSCLGRCDAAPACCVNGVLIGANEVESVLGDPQQLRSAAEGAAARRWEIDPYDSAEEHYGVLEEALSADCWSTEGGGVIARIQSSGLRGMGGAAFPTGVKWQLVREQSEVTKYVVCNADESEPGTFKDRVILAELPHLVIEGAILAARSVGAHWGFVFIRHEYEPERRKLERAVDAAYTAGILGSSICGSGFDFDLEIVTSPGGYILGEETALLETLEGRRGEPRNRPPFPGARGLWGKPTLVNNVETLAHIPRILRTGKAELKLFSVSGDVSRPGVCEVPIGTRVRELIERCGGMRDGAELLAFLPGGASSGFLPANRADVALDWDSLRAAGSALGAGAVVIVAEGVDLLDLAHNLTRFFRNESCGKCAPCRLGTEKALRLIEGGGDANLALISELHEVLLDTSLCGLGQVALVPISSVLTHFPDLARKSEG